MADCPPHETPMAGWGQMLQTFFLEKVKVENHAKGGASTNSFIDEGHFQKIEKAIRPGDYLFIQFGHNDQKPRGTKAYGDFQRNLATFAQLAKNKGGYPLFFTSVQRRHFDENGKIKHTLGEYPAAMRALGEQLHIPVIDLQSLTKQLYELFGVEGSKTLFVIFEPDEHPNYPAGIEDNTHFSQKGALEVARLVVNEIKRLDLPIKAYVKNVTSRM
ncbi:rhamnogalacturonan acetylesterase [Bacillus sp. NPDC077027]|uniref:rhamnogalacturonan acetylesterase n=1 Tax=Bacillus sp. NPDC077027 TaxID=3390548 RepID=UPI003D071C58